VTEQTGGFAVRAAGSRAATADIRITCTGWKGDEALRLTEGREEARAG
jgi:hypothetical protein